jgi:hypothetical protein
MLPWLPEKTVHSIAVATFVYAFFMKVTALSFVWYVRKRLATDESVLPDTPVLVSE